MPFFHINYEILMGLFRRTHHIKLTEENILKIARKLGTSYNINNAFGRVLNDLITHYYKRPEISNDFNKIMWADTPMKKLFQIFLEYNLKGIKK